MATLDQVEQALIRADKAGDSDGARILAGEVRRMRGDAAEITKKPMQETKSSWIDDVKGGIASGPINAFLGIKQMLPGGLSDEEKSILQMNKEASAKAPVSSVIGNALMLGPTALIPGANTMAGASTIGALTGLINPADSLKERALNTVVGGGAGAGGQYIGNKLAGALTSWLGKTDTAAATANALNKPTADALSAGREAGYVVPPSAVNPSWINKRLESIAGKAAVGQEAAVRNQPVTNALARKAAGLPDDVPLSQQALAGVRAEAGKPYQEVGGLSPIASQDLEALKQARFDANAYFKHYNVSADPASLIKAKDARSLSDMLEQSLQNEASTAGRPELLPQLADARKQIAKTYDIGRTINPGTGDVSAPVVGAMLKKGRPLTGELQTIGNMQQAFPSYLREGARIPTPGVSKSEALSAALLGTGGAMAGGPFGVALGALPLLSGPARSLVLSKPYQSMMANVPEKESLATLRLIEALMSKKAVQGAIPALSAQGVLGAAPMLQQ